MNPAIIAATLGRQIVSSIGQEVIQQIGSELGLPQSSIDMAQGAFASSMGDVQGAQQNYREAMQGVVSELQGLGARPADIGTVQRAAGSLESSFRDLVNEMLNRELQNDADEDAEGNNVVGGGTGSILMRIAVAVGQNMDRKMEDMAVKAEELEPVRKLPRTA